MLVLGIETSCDETGLALYDADRGLLGHVLYSQVKLHAEFGGVVPELASRDHVRKVLPLLDELLTKTDRAVKDIDAVAYTAGPGLVGALMVGAMAGKSLAYAWGVPSIAVHHMEAHLLAPMLEERPPTMPFVALLVSGGHTMLVEVTAIGQYRILGESVDDAAGEAFDKVAKMLELPYPGGPSVAKLAEQGDATRWQFPRPMVEDPGLNFSFSGLKTYTMNMLREHSDEQARADIAACFQEAVVDTLSIKCRRALRAADTTRLLLAGGVSANKLLRAKLQEMAIKLGFELFYPRFEFCTDNGAMIAYAGYQRLRLGQHDDLALYVFPRWPISEINISDVGIDA